MDTVVCRSTSATATNVYTFVVSAVPGMHESFPIILHTSVTLTLKSSCLYNWTRVRVRGNASVFLYVWMCSKVCGFVCRTYDLRFNKFYTILFYAIYVRYIWTNFSISDHCTKYINENGTLSVWCMRSIICLFWEYERTIVRTELVLIYLWLIFPTSPSLSLFCFAQPSMVERTKFHSFAVNKINT